MALITCKDVSLSYDNNVVVTDLSFKVEAGDYLCIVGENGSGKSTLIKALLSLKMPSSGSISYGDGLRHCNIGFLPQQSAAQKDFPASVWEVVLSGCSNGLGAKLFYSSEQKKQALDCMERLDIINLKKRSFRELSGGQQQRVLLARALCATGKLLLLDEPTAGLDPVVTGEFYNLIRQLNKDGMTIIMVSHDIHSALREASCILHLQKKPLFFGPKEEYLKSAAGRYFTGGDA